MFKIGVYNGGYWISMLVVSMLMGVLTVIIGTLFLKKPPKKINGIYGYRTARSMKNLDTWQFAQKYCGKIFVKYGIIFTILSVILFVSITLSVKTVEDLPTWVANIIVFIGALLLIFSIIPVEKALKNTFDKFGDRIRED